MKKTLPDEPIVPSNILNDKGNVEPSFGLTKREYFAALAMQGYLANQFNGEKPEKLLATWSVNAADALIEELNKKP